MSILVNLAIVIVTVAAMEYAAYWVHRHVMHGASGWGWHASHHEAHDDLLEKNDLYAVFFAGIAIALFWIGSAYWNPIWWVGMGVSVYGLLYFIVHDGLVHQRWPFRHVPRSGYLQRLYQAHKLHHAVEGRDGCVSFGFLYAPPVRDLKAQLREGGTAVGAPKGRGLDDGGRSPAT